MTRSIDGISTNPDTGRLTMSGRCNLPYCFIGQGTGTGNNTHFSRLVNVSWHNANLTLSWSDNTRTVWSDQTGIGSGQAGFHL